MVGNSQWLGTTLGAAAVEYEYNLLLLRSWAKRSPELEKIHVTVLLLSILMIETEYCKKTRFFPWPLHFREGEELAYPEREARIHYEHVHPFGQLQSVTDTACQLNLVLYTPHGVRVDSVREFYSEVHFYNLLCDWYPMSEAQRDERLTELFDDDCRKRFCLMVDALYGVDDEPERAPLYLSLSSKGFSEEEILGGAFLYADIIR
ncbi:uncharacterized protein LOC100902796 [Galendromus occidentalis]|uniref:Uncharacterized protein LOC100902796 n=1 Tax=Galendromus occidentalis TaxID=34638 RepID=A0AAJ6QWB5_9ACAR|nr:uncharacterized protein LOC100902796 [Galendromus occidentalis]